MKAPDQPGVLANRGAYSLNNCSRVTVSVREPAGDPEDGTQRVVAARISTSAGHAVERFIRTLNQAQWTAPGGAAVERCTVHRRAAQGQDKERTVAVI